MGGDNLWLLSDLDLSTSSVSEERDLDEKTKENLKLSSVIHFFHFISLLFLFSLYLQRKRYIILLILSIIYFFRVILYTSLFRLHKIEWKEVFIRSILYFVVENSIFYFSTLNILNSTNNTSIPGLPIPICIIITIFILLFWSASLFCERQLYMFKSKPENNGLLLTSGIYSFSLYPSIWFEFFSFLFWSCFTFNLPFILLFNSITFILTLTVLIPQKNNYLKSKYNLQWQSYQKDIKNIQSCI